MSSGDVEQQQLVHAEQQNLASVDVTKHGAKKWLNLVLVVVVFAGATAIIVKYSYAQGKTPTAIHNLHIEGILEKYAKKGPPPDGNLTNFVRDKWDKCIDFCAAKPEESCKSDEGRKAGCAWCMGMCHQSYSIQSWIVDRVRKEWLMRDAGKINGKEVPGDICAANSTTIFEGMDPLGSGQFWATYKDHRPYPYRVPIHIHMHEGQTCLIGGKINMYMEGIEPQTFGPGECYIMPANTKMANSPIDKNAGYTDTDTFHIPDTCTPTWVVIEPGAYWVQDAQFAPAGNECANLGKTVMGANVPGGV